MARLVVPLFWRFWEISVAKRDIGPHSQSQGQGQLLVNRRKRACLRMRNCYVRTVSSSYGSFRGGAPNLRRLDAGVLTQGGQIQIQTMVPRANCSPIYEAKHNHAGKLIYTKSAHVSFPSDHILLEAIAMTAMDGKKRKMRGIWTVCE